MKYRKLGRTGLDCSLLGFGTWQIGGGRWKGLGSKKSIYLLHSSLDYGINIYDAAIVYGQYMGSHNEKWSHSLELLGKAFRGTDRSKIIICLKVGQIDEYSHKANYHPSNIVADVNKALKQLNTDYIDVCLIHAPSINQVKDQKALTALQTLQALGIVKFIGYSFEAEPVHAKLALEQEIDVLMLQYNLLEQSCDEIFPIAEANGIGVLVGGPFRRGYLTGKYKEISDLPMSDNYWAWNIRYSKNKVEALLTQTNSLLEKAGDPFQLRKNAVHQIIKHSGVSSVIVGHRLEKEICENKKIIEELYQQI